MSQPKVVRSLLLLLFLGVVTGGIFFLLSLQLTPLLNEMGPHLSTTNSVMAEAAQPRPTPTPTMPELTLDMVATVPPTPVAPVPTIVTPAALPTALPSQRGTVNSDLVNLRSYPSLAGEIVGHAKQGEQFQIMAISNDGQWVQLCCPLGSSETTRQSWVSIEFMALEPALVIAQTAVPPTTVVHQPIAAAAVVAAASQTMPSAGAVSGTVNSALVNLRSGPDTTYPTVGQVSEQTRVTITGRNAAGTWWQICCPVGAPAASWISAEFIDLAAPKEEAMVQVATTIAP